MEYLIHKGKFTMKLMKLKLHSSSLAWDPSKALGRALAMNSQDHVFL